MYVCYNTPCECVFMIQGAQSMAFLMFLSIIPIIGVATYTFNNQQKPGGRGLLLCLVGMIGWSLMLLLITWPSRVLAPHLNVAGRFFFQLVVAFGWPLFVWEYLQREQVQIPRWLLTTVPIVPMSSVLLAVTNPLHYLVLDPATPATPVGISEFILGPWYLIHIGIASIFAMLPVGLLIRDFRGSHGIHRQQLLFLIGGWTVGFPGALLTHLFRNIESIPLYVDVTPLSFAVTALLWGLALDRYQLFSLVPVSRRRAVESFTDPVITTDQSDVVVDMNPAAAALFESGTTPIGMSIVELTRPYPELHALVAEPETPAEVTLTMNGETQHFVPRVQAITRGTLPAGTVYVLRDVTQLRDREADLELLNEVLARVFRHNVRNRLNVIDGYAAQIEAQDTAGTHTTEVETIRNTAQRLMSHSEKATILRKLINADEQTESIDLSQLARKQQQRIEQTTAVTVEAAIDDGVAVVAHPLVTVAVDELVDNAIEHHDEPAAATVSVEVHTTADQGVIQIEDDGPGIDPHELTALDVGKETDLTHGSGVGLWLVNIIARKSNGSVSITRGGADDGTRASLHLPRDG
jgi:signal transduction histidine kinase